VSRFRALAALAVGSALVLTGCAGTSAAPGSDAAQGADDVFPVTVDSALGQAVIEKKPERVATVAWSNHEVPLALGIVPVGMAKATWGDDDGDGVLPWVEDKLTELGAETPVLFDETDGIDFEAVADTQPDVILAAYSGLTQEDYDTLSKIAPVVAYPEAAWGTTMDQMIELNSKALGLEGEGEALIDQIKTESQEAFDAHPALAEVKPVFAFTDPTDFSTLTYYTAHDPRAGYLHEFGMPEPEQIVTATAETEAFYSEISAENADAFADVGLWITYGPTDGSLVAKLQADPLLSKVPAIAAGHIAVLEESTPLAASANPSPLSVSWGLSKYLDVLTSALG
jgi:iron complex transport system substrate-binding protein